MTWRSKISWVRKAPTAKQIKRFRKKWDLTQQRLGEQLGVSAQTVKCWESGRRNPMPMLSLALNALETEWEEP